jgi:hypothetical protein
LNNKPAQHDVCAESLPVHVRAELNNLGSAVAAEACAPKSELDGTFGKYAPIASIFQSAFLREPGMYKAAMPFLITSLTPLRIVHVPSRLPVTACALEQLRQGEAEPLLPMGSLQGARVVGHYSPDYAIVNDATGVFSLIEQIRNVKTVTSTLPRLRSTMLAAAMTAGAALGLNGCKVSAPRIRLAILDCSDNDSDMENGIYNLSEIDILLGTTGLGNALSYLKQRFRFELERQAELAIAEAHNPGEQEGMGQIVSSTKSLHFGDHHASRRRRSGSGLSRSAASVDRAQIAFAKSTQR